MLLCQPTFASVYEVFDLSSFGRVIYRGRFVVPGGILVIDRPMLDMIFFMLMLGGMDGV